MGAGGGTIYHSIRGWRNSPRGERMLGMTTAVKARAPVLGGNFAVWGLLFSSFDCTLAAVRRKEDPWNAIMSGTATSAVLSMRMGMRSMVRNGAVGGCILALIEGLQILLSQKLAEVPSQQMMRNNRAAPPPVVGTLGDSGSSWLSANQDLGNIDPVQLHNSYDDSYEENNYK